MAIILKNLIEKELGDVISELTTAYVKLGTVDGGAFFYCGPTKELQNLIPKFNKDNKLEHENRISRANENLNKAIEHFPEAKDYVLKEFIRTKGKKVGDVLGYLNFINQELNKIQVRIDKLEIMKKEEYISLEKRIVYDARISADEEDTSIIVIEGREVGNYWTRMEYENK